MPGDEGKVGLRVALVGPELEENLGLRSICATLKAAGHEAAVFDFHQEEQAPDLASRILDWGPAVVGLSMVFTRRAMEFVRFAELLRVQGFRGHITCGGHFATLHAERLLRDVGAIDSVLNGEGEELMVDLLAHLDEPGRVKGITHRVQRGDVVTTERRPPVRILDERPWPARPDLFDEHLTLPIAGMLAGRGCWASCRFCSIRAWHRRIGGPRFRQRTPTALAEEMSWLYHKRGVRLFNFHDDNFFHPDRGENLRRFSEWKRLLDDRDVGHIGLQIKARPDSIDPETVALLLRLGLYRVFLGIESNAVNGLKALGRGIRREQNERALEILAQASVHHTYNLMMFGPGCTLADVRENIAFIRHHAEVPQSFCRVEVYGGTPMERELRAQGRLEGDYFGYTYRLTNPASQRAYEMFRTVFADRVFNLEGMNPRAMALDQHLHILRHFWPERVHPMLARRVRRFIRELNEHSANLLTRLCDSAERGYSDRDAAAYAKSLARECCRFDRRMNRRANVLMAEMNNLARMPHSLARAGGTTLAIAIILMVIALLIVLIVSLFGDNIRSLFATSSELAGQEPPPADGGDGTNRCP